MIVLVVANLKGGTAKTCSAAFLAHAFHEHGQQVLFVDADPQGSAYRWSEVAEWPLPVVRLDSAKLHQQLPGIVGDRYSAVVIDTPPNETSRGIVVSALRAATHVVVPCAPAPGEVERLPATREALDDAADLRPDGRWPDTHILLTKYTPNTVAAQFWPDRMRADGWQVWPSWAADIQKFKQAWGSPVINATATVYGDAVATMLPAEVTR